MRDLVARIEDIRDRNARLIDDVSNARAESNGERLMKIRRVNKALDHVERVLNNAMDMAKEVPL